MMKTAIIYYFTGSGNTYKACEIYKNKFESEGIKTTLFNITSVMENIANPALFDYVGFAYPIHAFNAPYIMLDFAKKLPNNNKKYFIVKTSGEPLKLNNISSAGLINILKKKGYELSYESHYVMPYNMIFRHTDLMAYKMNEALYKLAPIDAMNIIKDKKKFLTKIPFGRIIAFLFRIEHKAMKVNGKLFKVDSSKCVNCKKCEKDCPVGNIHIDENGKFRFDNRCVMCTKCSFNCPKDAFKIGILNSWRVNGKYSFEKPETIEKDTHKWYCKKSYKKYFSNADNIM